MSSYCSLGHTAGQPSDWVSFGHDTELQKWAIEEPRVAQKRPAPISKPLVRVSYHSHEPSHALTIIAPP